MNKKSITITSFDNYVEGNFVPRNFLLLTDRYSSKCNNSDKVYKDNLIRLIQDEDETFISSVEVGEKNAIFSGLSHSISSCKGNLERNDVSNLLFSAETSSFL